MDSVLLVLRLILTVVFLVAGFAKLADLAGLRAAMRNFGVPAALASPFGVRLPLAELVVAVALLPVASVWWGASGALVLLLLFVAGIGYHLACGAHPRMVDFWIPWPPGARYPALPQKYSLKSPFGDCISVGEDSILDSAVGGSATGEQPDRRAARTHVSVVVS